MHSEDEICTFSFISISNGMKCPLQDKSDGSFVKLHRNIKHHQKTVRTQEQ